MNAESPLRASTNSRIPIRKVSPVSTPTKIRTPAKNNQTPPTLAAQRPPTSPSPFSLDRAPVPAAPAFKPLVLKKKSQIKVAKGDDEIEALSESLSRTGELSTRISLNCTDWTTRTDSPDILRASTQSRSSSSIGLARPASGLGYCTSRSSSVRVITDSNAVGIKDSTKRSPSAVFFRRLSSTISSATRKKVSTISSIVSDAGDQSALAESSIGAVANVTVASSFAEEVQRQHQRFVLSSPSF